MTQNEAIKIYDNALRSGKKDAPQHANIAKHLASVSNKDRANYLRRAPSVAKVLKEYL